jgi:transcriptional regulator with XRE-family HTH domain
MTPRRDRRNLDLANVSERVELVVAFGKRVGQLRELQGLSKEDLAARCGVHEAVLAAIERGQREPRLFLAVLLADALGVTAAELLNPLQQIPEDVS